MSVNNPHAKTVLFTTKLILVATENGKKYVVDAKPFVVSTKRLSGTQLFYYFIF